MDLLAQLQIKSVNAGAYSGSSWESAQHDQRLSSVNPNNGETIAEVSLCTMEDYQYLMERALQAFLEWREKPAPARGEIIRQVGQALRQNKALLGTLVSLEMGKSKQEGEGEIQEMIDMADFAVGQSRMLYGKTMHSERAQHRMYEQWHPYGIVGIISAFNFPVAVWAWNAFLAAICGNVIVWKPSAKTPLCAIAVHHLCSEVLKKNGCAEVFSLMIPNSREITTTFVKDVRIPLISFTGSAMVGKEVAVAVASRLGRSILELGGNNAITLDQSANLDLAIPAIVFGAIGTAGQRCTSTRRLFIHKSIYTSVLNRLKHVYQQITIGNSLKPQYLMGPLIDAQAVQQYQNALQEIVKQGGTIVIGGKVIDRPGYFVEPTLVTGLSNHSRIIQTETFAPILYVMSYDGLQEAIQLNNAVPQGLSSALFTQNLNQAEVFLSASGSDCGIANINIGTSGAEIGGAFGGEKETGGGRESGSDAWKGYMRRQTNTINWGDTLPLAQGIKLQLT